MTLNLKEDTLNIAKEKLMLALGDNMSAYLLNIKLWFRQKYTKEEFDIASRKLLDADRIHLHNQFFLALLNRIDTLIVPNTSISDSNSISSNALGSSKTSSSSNSRKRKRSSRQIGDRVTFEPVKIYEYLAEEFSEIVPPSTSAGSPPPIPPQLFASQELFLPHSGLVHGRLLVGAWENGLVNAEDNAAEYIVTAVQLLLKNIISAILLRKKHNRTTGGGTFFYDVGAQPKDLLLRNTVTRQHIDDSPIEIDRAITSWDLNRPINDNVTFLSACEEIYPVERRRISVQDVYNAFLDKNLIPSHGVHSVNFERISQIY